MSIYFFTSRTIFSLISYDAKILNISDDFNFSRKKKHPDVAYRSHEFFDTSLVNDGIHSGNRMSESVDGSDRVS